MKNRYNLPTLENLESRLLMSALTPWRIPVAADTIAVPASGQIAVAGNIQNQGCDRYQFVARASGVMMLDMTAGGAPTFNMSASTRGINPLLQVLDSAGRNLSSNGSAAGNRLDSQVELSVTAGKSYFVLAEGNNGTRGAYRVTWTSQPANGLGNTNATAQPLVLNQNSGSVNGSVNYSGDIDVFRIQPGISGNLTLTLAPTGIFALAGTLALGNGTTASLVSGQGTAGHSVTVTFAVTGGQVYYIRVGGVSSSQGQYQLQARVVQASPAPAPPAPAPTGGTLTIPTVTSADGAITVTTRQYSNGLQLLVVGTNGNDTITISQTSSGITVITASGAQNFNGVFTSVVIYGFDGNDTIRTTSTVTASVWIKDGNGNDSIFNAAAGQGTIACGSGTDLVVSVGAGRAAVAGGTGLDSFWVDSGDTLTAVSAASLQAKAVHQIAQFYQPYTNNPSSANYVPLTIAGQSLADPQIDGYASGYSNFSANPLFVNGPKFSDIHQGMNGDCYFLASLGALAQNEPQDIVQAIAPLGDGTYAVRFFRNGQAVYLRIDADLPVNGGSLVYAHAGSQGQLWAPLMEKAYAFFRSGQNSYASLWGGWMSDVFQDVANSGSNTLWLSPSSSLTNLASFLTAQLQAGHAVTAGSDSNSTGPIIGNHAYMVQSVTTTSQGTFVTVYNPWGVDGVNYDSNPGDGLLTLPIATFRQCFQAAIACAS
jgi:hypothetical protein